MDLTAQIPLAAILAGGEARRMGADKVGLLLEGVPLIERVWSRVSPVSERVVVVGGRPRLGHLGVATVADRYPGADAMGGIATALWYAEEMVGADTWVLCVGCDMPLLEPKLLQYLFSLRRGWDVVVPRVEAGYEPLCALYRAGCLPEFENQIEGGDLGIRRVFPKVRTREVGEKELRRLDPELRSLLNVNRPEDLEVARRVLRGAA